MIYGDECTVRWRNKYSAVVSFLLLMNPYMWCFNAQFQTHNSYNFRIRTILKFASGKNHSIILDPIVFSRLVCPKTTECCFLAVSHVGLYGDTDASFSFHRFPIGVFFILDIPVQQLLNTIEYHVYREISLCHHHFCQQSRSIKETIIQCRLEQLYCFGVLQYFHMFRISNRMHMHRQSIICWIPSTARF
jgi:hypothetical protein